MSGLIRGERDRDGVRVHVDDELLAPDSELWHTSQCFRNDAPNGPDWGHHSGGATQLALTILLAVTDSEEAERYHALFRTGVLALIRGDRWTLPVDQVRTLAGPRPGEGSPHGRRHGRPRRRRGG